VIGSVRRHLERRRADHVASQPLGYRRTDRGATSGADAPISSSTGRRSADHPTPAPLE
jgi:hypothetical protein